MTFSDALDHLKRGYRMHRDGWNGSGMFLYLVPGSVFDGSDARAPLNQFYEEGEEIEYRPHIDMKTAQGDLVPWVASQSDLLSDDWEFYS